MHSLTTQKRGELAVTAQNTSLHLLIAGRIPYAQFLLDIKLISMVNSQAV
jgi:hypothetical protein